MRHSIAPPGQTHSVLGDLPVAALRLEPSILAQLSRLGLRRIGDLAGQPRAALDRQFGKGLVLRLDQAFGNATEPMSPAAATPLFAVRLTLPDPIGLESVLTAAIKRMLPRLCAKLKTVNHGVRQLRLQAYRCDQTMQWLDIRLARAIADPDRIEPLLALKLMPALALTCCALRPPRPNRYTCINMRMLWITPPLRRVQWSRPPTSKI